MKTDTHIHRSPEQIKEHYLIEKALAHKLRVASGEERLDLYKKLYDELFRKVPHHPQLLLKASPEQQAAEISMQLRILARFLKTDCSFLEVGPGDCSLSLAIAGFVKHVYAVDVSKTITATRESCPPNFTLSLSDGCSIPVPPSSIDIAYSNQLIEHLHPDDATAHLKNIYTSLKPGGHYICITPNRLSGPYDISQYFDATASCFHLKEYTVGELYHQFRITGFNNIMVMIGQNRSFPLVIPAQIICLCEKLIALFPHASARFISLKIPMSCFRIIRILGEKSSL